jgi:hypothetical protein
MKNLRLLALSLAFACFLPLAAAAAPQPSWPSLAQQLKTDAVAPRSALEALIAANQDFSILRPEEAKDKLPIPLWLRVMWRRAHPELEYRANDPTGGYPLVLKEAHEWLVTHQDLVPGPAERDAEPEWEKSEWEKTAALSGEKRISGAQTSARSESDIRVNYWDPMKIISGSNANGAQAQFYSIDGGATWGQTSLPVNTGDAFHSDPALDWTSDGTAWSTTIGINSAVSVLQMRAYKSTNNGASWTFDATFSGSQTAADKQMIWVDHSATSPFKDNIYAIWHNGAPAYMNRRTGPAGSWQTPLRVSGAETTGTGIGGDVKTNASGDVFGFWPDTGGRGIYVVKSTNGGVSYGVPVKIATTFGGFDIGVPSFNNRRALIYVSAGAYRTANKDMVYASWADLTGAAGCTSGGEEPGPTTASTCKTRVWFARSTNGGATWSAPVMINNPSALNDQFNQWLVVDEMTGALAIMYYDTVLDAGRKKVDVWYQSSFDDGVTWSTAVRITSAQTDETVAGANSGNQFGDYNSLSGIAGQFFPSWTDRRNNAREEIWTAKVFDPVCTRPGAPAIGTAAATGPNQVQVTWGNGSPAAASFNVERAPGTCLSPGTFSRVGTSVAGSPFTDSTVSGGTTYAYRVTGLDATGRCESMPSGCVQATATGICLLNPSFAGLAGVTNAGANVCGLNLSWTAGTSACAGALTYNVYRSTTQGFTPAAGNRIATGVDGTSYTDAGALLNGVTYYYVVRAVDASNGLEEGNTVERSAAPTGPIASILNDTFEGAGGFDAAGWTHAPLTATMDWALSTARSQTPTHSWFSASTSTVSDRVLTSPPFAAQAGTRLSFWHTYAFENGCYDGGTLEVSTNGGGSWSPVPDAAFLSGGYVGTLSSGFANPIGGRRVWCNGALGAMTQVVVSLASYAGPDVQLRWREGDDSSSQGTGWYVDSVTITNVNACGGNALFSDGFESGTLDAWSGKTP